MGCNTEACAVQHSVNLLCETLARTFQDNCNRIVFLSIEGIERGYKWLRIISVPCSTNPFLTNYQRDVKKVIPKHYEVKKKKYIYMYKCQTDIECL